MRENKNTCSIEKIHNKTVKSVLEKLEDEETVYNMATLFSTFSDSTRLKILLCLSRAKLCSCDISAAVNISKSATSHQMRILKMTKLVKAERKGKQIFYSLSDEHVSILLQAALEHVKEGKK